MNICFFDPIANSEAKTMVLRPWLSLIKRFLRVYRMKLYYYTFIFSDDKHNKLPVHQRILHQIF